MANSGDTLAERAVKVNDITTLLTSSQKPHTRSTTATAITVASTIDESLVSSGMNSDSDSDSDTMEEEEEEEELMDETELSIDDLHITAGAGEAAAGAVVMTSDTLNQQTKFSDSSSRHSSLSPLPPVRRGVGLFLTAVGVQFTHPRRPTDVIRIHIYNQTTSPTNRANISDMINNYSSDTARDTDTVINRGASTKSSVNTSTRFTKLLMKARKGYEWTQQSERRTPSRVIL